MKEGRGEGEAGGLRRAEGGLGRDEAREEGEIEEEKRKLERREGRREEMKEGGGIDGAW